MNPYVGWAATTLLSWVMNKGTIGSEEQANAKADELSITETKTGTPIPVVMGRTLLKRPLVIYYGDFRADQYTETYAAHANFSAWPLVFTLIAQYLMAPITGHQATSGVVTAKGGNSAGPVNSTGTSDGATYKDDLTGPLINVLFQWLLMWLINGRNLKTTMQKGFKYHLGYQMLFGWSGPGARLRAVYLGKNKVWEGDESREAHAPGSFTVKVNDDNLFGGPDEGGGFIGDMHFYLGGPDQQTDSWMVEQMKSTSIQEDLRGLTPAYRPFVSVVVPTAYIGKQATIPETWIDYQWIPNRLGLGGIGDDANPAEVIFEAHVNDEWGMNESPDSLNIEALKIVGQKLKEEKLGITVAITSKSSAANIIDAICEHVNMVRYKDPQTGKQTYKLIRDDYDPAKVPILNEKNCSNFTMSRLDWRETIGAISVSYTDRAAMYEQSSLQANDPAVIEINDNNKTTKSYEYLYFTSAENALWAAKRESRQQGYPLAAASVEGNRTLSAIRTGEVVRVDWPPYGIKNMFFRVTDVDLGNFVDGKVKLELLEDVFGLEKTQFGYSGSSDWIPDVVYPTGVTDYRFIELPWELMPEKNTYVFALAAQPNKDTEKWTVWRNHYPDGWTSTTSMTKWTPTGRLVYDYAEFTNVIDMVGIEIANISGIEFLKSAILTGGSPDIVSARRGGKVFVMGEEIMAYSSIDQLPNGNWRLQGIIRGAFDTVPMAHSAGESVFFMDPSHYSNVTTGGPVCEAGDITTEDYNITTATAYANEDFNMVKSKQLTTRRRAERPNAPGKLRMSCFKQLDVTHLPELVGDISLTWVNRNKQMQSFGVASQDDENEYWTGQPYKLPEGANYKIKVFVAGKQVAEYITKDNNYTYTWAQRCLDGSGDWGSETRLEIYTVMNGLESYQPQRRIFQWKVPQMIDACIDETEIQEKLDKWGLADRVVVPESDYASEFQILHKNMGIFILGKEVVVSTQGAVLSRDGKYILPNGQIAVVNGKGDYTLGKMSNGYIFQSRYVVQASGGDIHYTYTE